MATNRNLPDIVAEYKKSFQEFKNFEAQYLSKKRIGLRSLAVYIKDFQNWLSRFVGLYNEISADAIIKTDVSVTHRQLLDVISIRITTIQSVYLMQLSQEYSRKSNRFNIWLAFFSILIGIICTIWSNLYSEQQARKSRQDDAQFRTTLLNGISSIKEMDTAIIRSINVRQQPTVSGDSLKR